jgi:simple sugar transport system ATP-binding protein
LALISLVGITKRFGSVVALDNVSLSVESGEILGLLGENGSGKSTLTKIIYGVYVPDSGYIELRTDGLMRRAFFSSPKEALLSGIVMISQRPQLVEELSVLDNIALFLGYSRGRTRKIVESTMSRFNIKLNADALVGSLSYTEKQLVELVKALSFKPRLLILDEATTYLPRDVKARFYEALRTFASIGGSVIFITHKIPEALEVCDRIAVLRRGRLVRIFSRKDVFSIDDLRKAMFEEVSPSVATERVEEARAEGGEVLRAEGLVVLDDYGKRAVSIDELVVERGSVHAVVGVAGNGQKELCEGLSGLRKAVEGRVVLDGENVTRSRASERALKGLVYIPEDPFRTGVVLDLTIMENIRLFATGRLSSDTVKKVIRELRISPSEPRIKSYMLSGGNLQKLSLSRALLLNPKCMIVHNPTRMLDEASSRQVKLLLRDSARKGVGVLLVSEDIDEVIDVADKISVIANGRIVKTLPAMHPRLREEIEEAMSTYA